MGVEGSIRINGPYRVDVDFPNRLTKAIVPESFEDITSSVEVLTPPTPVYGAVVGGGMPLGLVVDGARPLGSIKLPVFEWTGAETSLSSPRPYRNQRYFALENKFQGEEYLTPRVTIGKIAIFDGMVACAVPVKDSRLSRAQIRETIVANQPTVEQSVARAVFAIINGETESEGTYQILQRAYEHSKSQNLHRALQRLRERLPQPTNQLRRTLALGTEDVSEVQ